MFPRNLHEVIAQAPQPDEDGDYQEGDRLVIRLGGDYRVVEVASSRNGIFSGNTVGGVGEALYVEDLRAGDVVTDPVGSVEEAMKRL